VCVESGTTCPLACNVKLSTSAAAPSAKWNVRLSVTPTPATNPLNGSGPDAEAHLGATTAAAPAPNPAFNNHRRPTGDPINWAIVPCTPTSLIDPTTPHTHRETEPT
jgi:hypothetical protein